MYPTTLTYAHGGHVAGAPDIWVSPNKHANYANQTDCNNGGGYYGVGKDDCSENDGWTQMYLYDTYVGARNVGSGAVHLIDTIPSRIPPYSSNGYIEAYWSFEHFAGWSGISSPVAPGYKYRLGPWGFDVD